MDDFQKALERTFPGSVPCTEYLAGVQQSIEFHGFETDRTLPLVSICRDELTTNFFAQVQQRWGPAFTLAGLGGVPALGTTGWDAAFAHIPSSTERGSLLVLGFPHIGIETDGSIGVTLRRNQTEPTATCGALSSIFERSINGTLPTEVDLDDYEATRLALRLVDPARPPASLVELTISALEILEVDLWRAIDKAEIWRDHDVTVWCGIQIHGHDGDDWIWPRDAWYTRNDGDRRRVNPTAS